MTVAPASFPGEVGCVLRREPGVLVVLTDAGEVRASYGAGLLADLARDRTREPQVGDWVRLRGWYDGPVTVEGHLPVPAARPLAPVLPLRPRRRSGRRAD